jgi:hypothetical protein
MEEETLLDVHAACWAGNLDALLQLLLLRGAGAGGDEAVARAVRLAAARDATRLGGGNTPLHYAAACGARALGCLDLLLRLRVPLDARNDAGATPLFLAAQAANAEAVATLMRRGADPTLCEAQSGCSLSPAEVADGDARVLAALAGGALRGRGLLFARPSRLRAPALLAPAELVFATDADAAGAGAPEAVGVRLRPRQPLRVHLDLAWAASVSRISGREAARLAVSDEGKSSAALDDGIVRLPPPPPPPSLPLRGERRAVTEWDGNDDEQDEGSASRYSSAGDALLDADAEFAKRLPSVALVPLPWASIEVGVIDVTVASEPAVARRVLLGRKACEAAGHVCVVEGLAAGRTYMVKARAVNALGRGTWSAPTLPITIGGAGGGGGNPNAADEEQSGAGTRRAAAAASSATPFSALSSSARLGEAWAEEAAAVGEREVLRSSTPRAPSVRLEELGASVMPAAEFAAMTARRTLLSVRSSASGRAAPKAPSREQQAAAEAAEAAALAAAIAAAQAAARAAALPRAIGRGVMAAPLRAPGAKPAPPPKPPRAPNAAPGVIYREAPDTRGDEDDEGEEEAEQGAAAPREGATGAAPAPAAVSPARAVRAHSPVRPKAKKKAASTKATTLGGVRQPRRYFAPAYYEDPYARQMGESMIRDEALERERLIEIARAEGNAEALAAAEAEVAAAARTAEEAEEEEEEVQEQQQLTHVPRPPRTADNEEAGGADTDAALRGAADRTVRFVEVNKRSPSAEQQPTPKRKSKLHDSSLRSFLLASAEESRAKREGLGLHLDLSALADRLPGVLREGAYDPAQSPAASLALAEDAALGLSLRSLGPAAAGLGARSERLSMSARIAGDDAEALAQRQREALEAVLSGGGGGGGRGGVRAARPVPEAKAATRGGALSLFVTTPYQSYGGAPRVADMLIAQQRKSSRVANAFSAGSAARPSLLGPGLTASDLLHGGRGAGR